MGNVYSTVYGTARMLINPPPWKRLQHPTRIWMLGIDAAGKTTVMYQLSRRQFPHAEIVTTIPTIGFNLETVEFDRLSVTAFDMGGARKCQPLERERIRSYSDGIVWVIDCNDRDRLVETREELSEFVLKQEDLREVPLLLLANKWDCKESFDVHNVLRCLIKANGMAGRDRKGGYEHRDS